MWALISYTAATLGFASTWLVAKHNWGWWVGVACCTLWLAYDIDRAIWAGAISAVVSGGLGVRAWWYRRNKTLSDATDYPSDE